MMNATGLGRFVKDPELKKVKDTYVCEFALAINEHRKVNGEKKKFTSFLNFVVWDKAAEVMAEYGRKGDLIFFSATPRQEKWVDKDGNNRERVLFRINEFNFVSAASKNKGDDTGEQKLDDPSQPLDDDTPF